MPTTQTGRKALVMLVAAGSALTLAACGDDGVLTNGSIAAQLGANKVSIADVQSAVTDLRAVNPQSPYTQQQAAIFLALAPEVHRLASRFGITESASSVEAQFRQNGVTEPSAPSVDVVRVNSELSQMLRGNSDWMKAANDLIATADVKLNPRYGSYRKGGAIGPATTNWIEPKATATPTAQQ